MIDLLKSWDRADYPPPGPQANHVYNGIWDWDIQNDSLYWSPRLKEWLGYTEEALQTSLGVFAVLLHPDDRARVDAALEAHLKDGAPYDVELRQLTKSGEYRWFRDRGTAIRDESGQPIRMVGFSADITERKQAEDALRALLAEREVLLKEVYHRVKNNLTAIIGLINMHQAGAADPATAALLVELEDRIRSMALVHENLYQSQDLAHINLQDYLETLIAQLRASWDPRLDVHFSVEAAGVEMGLDTAIPCGLILNELITNALKYAFPGGQPRPGERDCKITISATWDGGAEDSGDYTLTVADNGVGLPAGLDWAAAPGAERAAKTLGLRLVRLLVQHQLAGHIEIDRASGTRFTLKFASRHRR